MGLNMHTMNMLLEALDLVEISSFEGLSICELGNLYVRDCVHPFLKDRDIPLYKTAKELFTHLGMKDTSLDWNGQDGALPVDLSKPVKNIGTFDIIMNGGTAEHVYDQYECWRNIHNLCKEYGLVVSIGPLSGSWLNHSPWRYSLKFFDCLSFINNYDLLERRMLSFEDRADLDCHCVSFRKGAGRFMSRELFIKIWNNHHKEKMVYDKKRRYNYN